MPDVQAQQFIVPPPAPGAAPMSDREAWSLGINRMKAQADRRGRSPDGRWGEREFSPMEEACIAVENSTFIGRHGFVEWYGSKSRIRRAAAAHGLLGLHRTRLLLTRAMRLVPASPASEWSEDYPNVDCVILARLEAIAAEIGRAEQSVMARVIAVMRTLPYDGGVS